MAKVRIKHPDTGVVYTVDVNNLTEEDLRRLERLNIAEEVKPKRKKKYKNVEHKKDEKPSYEEVEKQELDEYLNEKIDDGWGEEVCDENAKEKTEKALKLRAEEIDALEEMKKWENKSDK